MRDRRRRGRWRLLVRSMINVDTDTRRGRVVLARGICARIIRRIPMLLGGVQDGSQSRWQLLGSRSLFDCHGERQVLALYNRRIYVLAISQWQASNAQNAEDKAELLYRVWRGQNHRVLEV